MRYMNLLWLAILSFGVQAETDVAEIERYRNPERARTAPAP